MMLRYLVMLTLSLAMVGCASNTKPEAARSDKHQGGDDGSFIVPKTEPKPSPSVGGELQGKACDSQGTAGLNLFPSGSADIDGHLEILRSSKRQEISLCDALELANAEVAIFQFAGVTCLECIELSKWFGEELRKSKYQGIKHVIVFTDFFEDEPEQGFVDFMKKYGSHASRVHDEAKLWKKLSKDSAAPDRATVLAFNQEMEAYVLNEPGKSKEILKHALSLMPKPKVETDR